MLLPGLFLGPFGAFSTAVHCLLHIKLYFRMPQSNKSEPPAREIASARKTITEQDRQLAESAFSQFKSANYEGCFQQLKKLAELRPHDARVAANKAVVEYYVSKFSKTDDFMKQLNAVKKQVLVLYILNKIHIANKCNLFKRRPCFFKGNNGNVL